MSETCPFCGHDPFHRVDNGCGMEAVAVNCCELGCFLYGKAEETTVTRDELLSIVSTLAEQAKTIEGLEHQSAVHEADAGVWQERATTAESALTTARDRAIEEAAGVADAAAEKHKIPRPHTARNFDDGKRYCAEEIATAIRALVAELRA